MKGCYDTAGKKKMCGGKKGGNRAREDWDLGAIKTQEKVKPERHRRVRQIRWKKGGYKVYGLGKGRRGGSTARTICSS